MSLDFLDFLASRLRDQEVDCWLESEEEVLSPIPRFWGYQALLTDGWVRTLNFWAHSLQVSGYNPSHEVCICGGCSSS